MNAAALPLAYMGEIVVVYEHAIAWMEPCHGYEDTVIHLLNGEDLTVMVAMGEVLDRLAGKATLAPREVR